VCSHFVYKAYFTLASVSSSSSSSSSVSPLFRHPYQVKNAVRDPQPGVKRRVFNVAPPFARAYGVPLKKAGYDLLAPALEFNLSKLAYKASTDKDTAATILSAMIRCLGAAVRMLTWCLFVWACLA